MKRWRRPLMLIALLLLAGAVVNVGVAWGIAALTTELRPLDAARVQRDIPRGFPTPPEWPRRCDRAFIQSAFGMSLLNETTVADGQRWIAAISQVGWPARSLQNVRLVATGRRGQQPAPPVLHAGFQPPSIALDRRLFFTTWNRVPLLPVLPGFLLGSAFYAALLAPLPIGLLAIRRRHRRRRGRCPKCGYDLAGLEEKAGADPTTPCPECGAVR